MADYKQIQPCPQCDAVEIAKMLALRKQLDPDAPDMVVLPESVVGEDLIDSVLRILGNRGITETTYAKLKAVLAAPTSEQEERLEFAADVSRNQQLRINELERIVKLLLRYVDHQRGCTSYTNGPCTCGFESAMRDPGIAYDDSRRQR